MEDAGKMPALPSIHDLQSHLLRVSWRPLRLGGKSFFKESAPRGRIALPVRETRIKRQEKRGKKQRGMVGLGQDVPATGKMRLFHFFPMTDDR
jgi:hypothetical protein